MIKRITLISILYTFLSCATEYNTKDLLKRVALYTQEGRFQEAYNLFVSELRDRYGDIQLHKEFVRFVSNIHRCDEAHNFYKQNRTEKYEYIFYYATALLMAVCGSGNKDEIIKNLSEAMRLRPDDCEIRLRFGAILMEYEMYDEALSQFKYISSRPSKPFSVYSYIALCEAHLGHLDEARKNIAILLENDFSDSDLLRVSNASEIINSDCLSVPEDIKADFKKVLDMVLIGERPSAANEVLKNLIVKYPSVSALHLLNGMVLALMGEYSAALYELDTVSDGWRDCSYFQYTRGIIYLGAQKEDKAIIYLENAIRLDPLFIRAYRILSEIYLNRKEYEKAERLLRVYLKIRRDDHQNRFLYGRLLIKLKKIKEAEAQIRYIFNKDPENILGIVGLGLIERELAKMEKDEKKRRSHLINSVQYLNKAINKDPDNQEIKDLITSIDEKEE